MKMMLQVTQMILTSREKLLKNKLCGEGQNLRFLSIQNMALQIQVIEYQIKSIVKIVLDF